MYSCSTAVNAMPTCVSVLRRPTLNDERESSLAEYGYDDIFNYGLVSAALLCFALLGSAHCQAACYTSGCDDGLG